MRCRLSPTADVPSHTSGAAMCQNRKSPGYSTTPRLLALHNELAARDAVLRIVGAHGWGRDLLRADGIAEKVGGLDKVATLHGLLGADAP
jgi:hypothetical protein